MTAMPGRAVDIRGATEHTLRDVDVSFGAGITAVVGVSGSGKSSLIADTLFHEARRRFLETLSLGSPWAQLRPARVRSIDGLGPAVAVAQNVVNRNPNSTVATATGIHPVLRILYASFAARACAGCGREPGFVATSHEQQFSWLRDAVDTLPNVGEDGLELVVPLVRATEGTHRRLLDFLADRFGPDAVDVDGKALATGHDGGLLADQPHDIDLRLETLHAGATTDDLRAILRTVRGLGATQVRLRTPAGDVRAMSCAPVCPTCGELLPSLRAPDFAPAGDERARAYHLGGRTLQGYLALSVSEATAALDEFGLPPTASRALEQVRVRLEALAAMELGYLPLDRPSPTLSRGEAQRLRLAVILATQVEDLLHVLDEPTVGLDAEQVVRLIRQLAKLRGPVLMVEHDRWAVADADDVVELGPGGGVEGGRLTFQGPPAQLWCADTVTGRWFSGREVVAVRAGSRREPGMTTLPMRSTPRPGVDAPSTPHAHSQRGYSQAVAPARLAIFGAYAHNLQRLDCEIPVGRITVVTGPSGAGKSTLARDVIVASLDAGEPRGCERLEGPRLKAITVDQSPIGRNPRSNPATYTGLAGQLRDRFAAATGLPASAFSFNRPDGACTTCSGMGAVELTLLHLPSEWLPCEDCGGQRFGADVREARVELADGRHYTIAEVYDLTIDQAAPLLADDRKAQRILSALRDTGLGYLRLGQPSPTLSGGEAQRVKVTKALTRARAGSLVLLDEPTTGLHPADLARLIGILDRLVAEGCTVLVVEHHPDIVAAADWVVRLGPGGGPDGGRLRSACAPADMAERQAPMPRPRERARRKPRGSPAITVTRAHANNLRDVSVTFPKNAITAIVGVSGSGKSSLLTDVLAAEADRRLLECLSMYERQSVKEGPAADVESVEGLGPTVVIGPDRDRGSPRRTVGTATELSFHLGVLLAYAGSGGAGRSGRGSGRAGDPGGTGAAGGDVLAGLTPTHFSPGSYEAACLTCHGLGTVPEPRPERLIVRPDAPLCKGAMYSPGFFPQSYLSKPANHGYWMIQGLAQRYGFDPFETPWDQMTDAAREAFLFGEPGTKGPHLNRESWVGFFPIVAGWDQGGRYVDHVTCSSCAGGRLRPEFLAVRLGGANRQDLHEWPLSKVADVVEGISTPAAAPGWVATSRLVALRRLRFLEGVGLGYVHLDRTSASLSAGEAQRVKLAGLLGAELTGMTVLLDEPTRGLHPREVDALGAALCRLRDAGNTVLLVDHDPDLVARADRVLVVGPGAGREGGRLLSSRSADARALLPTHTGADVRSPRRVATGWMRVVGPRANNLSGADIDLLLGVLAGICGVSGSGKSTLGIDTLAMALDPPRSSTSVAYESVDPGAHDAILGGPARVVWSDQSRTGIHSPGQHLGVLRVLRQAYAEFDAAAAHDLTEKDLAPSCDACHGRGFVRQDMGFLPSIESPCDACDATGYGEEARRIVVRGHSLPALTQLTLTEVGELWPDRSGVARLLEQACALGLGYLRLGQPSHSLSGGEAQRLKLARELGRRTRKPTLFLLDEPTLGLHPLDVTRLRAALDGLVDAGHSVLVVEHDPGLLAGCDWLLELGPGAGPDGGRVIATGTPEEIALGTTPTAPYLAAVLP
jgi:excinuclease ABC subunit A